MKKILLTSIAFPVLHVIFFPPTKISPPKSNLSEYAMGYPFHFIWYRDFDGFVSNKLLLFTPTEFLKTEINLIYYFLSVLVFYLVILFINKLYKSIFP